MNTLIDMLFVYEYGITLFTLIFAMVGCYAMGAFFFYWGGYLTGIAKGSPHDKELIESLKKDRNNYRAIIQEHGEGWKL